MAYQALYRRWRPQGFDGIVGQDAVVATLKNQIKSNRIGHAYLFCGTRGTGKTSAAKIFARAVNCPHAAEHDGSPCNECETCKSIASGRAMNVFEIDAASNNGVDNIRDIKEQVEYPPVAGRFKVYIIDEVHMLSPGAFNALLKTLEEPPSYVIFILATTDPQKLPATILSRCQRYDFKRISRAKIAAHLKEITVREEINAEDKALSFIAEAADGSMRDSLSILDQCLAYHYGEPLSYDNVLNILGAADDSIYSELFDKILNHDVEGVLERAAELINDGCEPGRIINDFIMYLRNVLLVKSMGNNELLELSEERYEHALRSGERTDSKTIIRIIASLSELANRTRFSTQRRTALEVELIRLCTYGMAGYAAVPTAPQITRQATGQAVLNANTARSTATFASATANAGGANNAGTHTENHIRNANAAGGTNNAENYNIHSDDAGARENYSNPMSAKLSVSLKGAADSSEVPWQSDGREETGSEPRTNAASASTKDAILGRTGVTAARQAEAGRTDQSEAGGKNETGTPETADKNVRAYGQGEASSSSETEKSRGQGAKIELATDTEPQTQTPDGSIYSMIMKNWGMLMAGLSPSNRPLFNDILVRDEGSKIVLVFKNQMNFRLAAGNKDENGVIRLRELAEEQLHVRVNFTARAAKPGEINTEVPRATPEELAKINFPISIED